MVWESFEIYDACCREPGSVPSYANMAGRDTEGEGVIIISCRGCMQLEGKTMQIQVQRKKGVGWGLVVLNYICTTQLRCVTEGVVFHHMLLESVVGGRQRGALQ